MVYSLSNLKYANWRDPKTFQSFYGLRNAETYDYLFINYHKETEAYRLWVYLSEMSLEQGYYYLLDRDFPPHLVPYAVKQGVRFTKPRFRVKAHGQKT